MKLTMMSMCFFPGSAFISRGAITEVVAKAPPPPNPAVATKLPKLSFVCFHFPAPSVDPLAVPKLPKMGGSIKYFSRFKYWDLQCKFYTILRICGRSPLYTSNNIVTIYVLERSA